jgi:hypothetical protein
MTHQIPPRSPGSASHLAIPREDAPARRPSQSDDLPENDREFLLRTFRDQTEELGGKIDELRRDTDGRLMALEKRALEESKTGVAVQELSGKIGALNANVETILRSERLQDQDIGILKDRLQTALRPAVVAEASTEGQAAGLVAGKRAGRVWGGLGVALSVVAVSLMQYCESQVKNGLFSDPKTDPGMSHSPSK